MKKEELNLKLLVCLPERGERILKALAEKKLIDFGEPVPAVKVIVCEEGNVYWRYSSDTIENWEHLPEVTFEQALELIEQVEIEDDKSEWGLVSFDIFENEGRYVYYENDCVGYAWQNHINCEIKTGMIFAGWQYEKGETLNTRRGNVNHGGFCRTVDFPKNLKAPAIPIKIWFWRRK
jgi:hypothetical protein